MATKPNIAEILKDCPKGMEMYSPIFGKVYLYEVRPHLAVIVNIGDEHSKDQEEFLYDGRYGLNGECMLFPSKDKGSWDGFVPPVTFKDGDVVATGSGDWIGITSGGKSGTFIPTYCVLTERKELRVYPDYREELKFDRLATEEEKKKLFDAIKEHGYVWDAENNKLEKRTEPAFKVGDAIHEIGDEAGYFVISYIDDLHYYCDLRLLGRRVICDISDQDLWQLVPEEEPPVTFKNGDIVASENGNWIFIFESSVGKTNKCHVAYDAICDNISRISVGWAFSRYATKEEKDRLFKAIKKNGYVWNAETKKLDKLEDHKKFDINTLKPFDKVLVRDSYSEEWNVDFFSYHQNDGTCRCMTFTRNQCVPFEGNEHLLGTTDPCADFYNTWG